MSIRWTPPADEEIAAREAAERAQLRAERAEAYRYRKDEGLIPDAFGTLEDRLRDLFGDPLPCVNKDEIGDALPKEIFMRICEMIYDGVVDEIDEEFGVDRLACTWHHHKHE